MPSYTKVSLTANALVRLGEAPIQSLSDKRATAVAAATVFDEIFAERLASYPWSFALSTVDPAQLGSPVNDLTRWYDFAYPVPVDALRVLRLSSRALYELASENELWTDDDDAEIWYIKDIPVNQIKPWFASAMVKELASAFAISITGDNTRADLLARQAEKQWVMARNDDSQQRTPAQLRYMDLIRAEPEILF